MKYIGILFCLFISNLALIAQTNGVLPLTGIQYFNEGIYAKYVDVSIDGKALTRNRIPVNKEFLVTLKLPSGFTEDAGKKIYPAAEVSYLSPTKKLLSPSVNMLQANEKTGFAAIMLKEIPLKLKIPAEWMYEKQLTVQIRYYDLKSKKQMRVYFPVTLALANEAAAVSKLTRVIPVSDASMAISNGVNIKNAVIMVDTAIRVKPQNAYLSIEMPYITGTSMAEVLSGKNNVWVYDKNGKEIIIKDKLLKKVGGSLEDQIVDYTLKIPFRLKTDIPNGYTVRFRWDSPNGDKIIDIVTSL
ncbi:MAG: hypothetical protein ABIT96_04750 [Ferruginibacter sp.]